MVSSVVDDAFSPDDGTSCDLENPFFEYLGIAVHESVYCRSSTSNGQFFKITVNHIYQESFRELESKIKHIVEKNYLQIDLASSATEALKHSDLSPDINCVGTLTIVASSFLDTNKTDVTTKVNFLTVTEKLQEYLLILFMRHAFKLESFICKNNIVWTRSTACGFKSVCQKGMFLNFISHDIFIILSLFILQHRSAIFAFVLYFLELLENRW